MYFHTDYTKVEEFAFDVYFKDVFEVGCSEQAFCLFEMDIHLMKAQTNKLSCLRELQKTGGKHTKSLRYEFYYKSTKINITEFILRRVAENKSVLLSSLVQSLSSFIVDKTILCFCKKQKAHSY